MADDHAFAEGVKYGEHRAGKSEAAIRAEARAEALREVCEKVEIEVDNQQRSAAIRQEQIGGRHRHCSVILGSLLEEIQGLATANQPAAISAMSDNSKPTDRKSDSKRP